jgi:hypothetical protein
MLDPFSRNTLVAVAGLCVAATIALAPIRARSSIESPASAPLSVPRDASGDEAVTSIAVARDPFDEPGPGAANARAAGSAANPASPASEMSLEPLPANVTDPIVPAMPGAAADAGGTSTRVTAVVTGAHPYALIERAGIHSIEGLGDRIGNSTIRTIDIDGVRLSSGERLSVDRETTP